MKKATHIVALPVLTALLAACAAPNPERLDQIESAATALADETLVEGLRDDFEEVKKQWDAAKEQATEAHQQVFMAGLEDDFEEVEKQLGEVEGETDLAAKLDLVDELKKNLDKLALKVSAEALKVSAEEGGDTSLYRELKYTFENLDAVELTKENRMQYVTDLTTEFTDNQVKQNYKLDPILYQQNRVGEPPRWGREKILKGWELSGVQFMLSNLERGIPESSRKEIDKFVKIVTDNNATGLVEGTPVVKKAAQPKPVTFKTLEVYYSSTSGLGKIISRKPNCPDVELRYELGAIGKQPNAIPYIVPKAGDKPERADDPSKFVFKFPSEWVKEKGCVVVPDTKTAFLMVLLKGAGIYVAEYHIVTGKVPSGETASKPMRGRLTTDKPACPPKGFPEGFKTILEEAAGSCV